MSLEAMNHTAVMANNHLTDYVQASCSAHSGFIPSYFSMITPINGAGCVQVLQHILQEQGGRGCAQTCPNSYSKLHCCKSDLSTAISINIHILQTVKSSGKTTQGRDCSHSPESALRCCVCVCVCGHRYDNHMYLITVLCVSGLASHHQALKSLRSLNSYGIERALVRRQSSYVREQEASFLYNCRLANRFGALKLGIRV